MTGVVGRGATGLGVDGRGAARVGLTAVVVTVVGAFTTGLSVTLVAQLLSAALERMVSRRVFDFMLSDLKKLAHGEGEGLALDGCFGTRFIQHVVGFEP